MVASKWMCPDQYIRIYIRSICAFTLPGGQIRDQKYDRASKWNQTYCSWDEHEFLGSDKPNPLHKHLRWSRMTWCWSSVVKPMRPQHFRGKGHGRRRTMAESSGSDQGFFHFDAVGKLDETILKRVEGCGSYNYFIWIFWRRLSLPMNIYIYIYTYYICMWLIFKGFSCRDAL